MIAPPVAWTATLTCLLVTATAATGQGRVIGATVFQGHINYEHRNFRGSNLFLVQQPELEMLWNHFDANKPALEMHMAQVARLGSNMMRVWGSYASFLYHDVVKTGASAGQYADRVRQLLEAAEEYELGVMYSMLNSYGSPTHEAMFQNSAPYPPHGVSRAPAPDIYWAVIDDVATVPFAFFGSVFQGELRSAVWSFPADQPDLDLGVHRSAITPWHLDQWRLNPAQYAHGLQAYIDGVGSVIGAKKALHSFQIANEPGVGLDLSADTGWRWGHKLDRMYSWLDPLATNAPPANPQRRPITMAMKSTSDYRDPAGTLLDVFIAGYPTANGRPKAALGGWCIHNLSDPYVRNTNSGNTTRTELERSHALHTELQQQWTGTFDAREASTDETMSRAGSLQHAADLALHAINPFTDPATPRLGLIAWSLFPSRMAQTEPGAIALPGGTVISTREWEAFKDNYRYLPEGSPPAGYLARDLSDMVLPVLAAQPTGDLVLAILAENYDDRGVHSSPAPTTPYAQANKLFYRGGFRLSGSITFPGSLPPAAVTSVGPLAFDESRHALAGTAFPPKPAKDPLWPGTNHSGAGLAHPAVESSVPTSNTDNPGPYLRSDILHRQKLKAIDQPLEPSAIFLRDVTEGGNTKSEFLVAYCRPTSRAPENTGESYDPEAGTVNSNPAQTEQKYFAPFKQSVDGPWKYEIWADKVKVHHDGSVTVESRELLRTRGEHAEADLHANGFNAHSSPSPGASAIMPKLFASDEGDAVLVYLKSQDSWFDVKCDYGSGQLDLAAWENQSSWHVYPWEVFAMLWDKNIQDWVRDTHGGPKEYRISPLYPGGWNQWFADTKVNLRWVTSPENLPNNPRSVRRARLAEFFPAIEPTAAVWRDGTTLKAAVYFKMLNTRLPDIFGWGSGARVPFGYDVMFTKFTGSSWDPPARLYCSLCMPPDEVPDNYDSHEHVFVQNGLRTVRAPGVSAEPLTIFQLENLVHVSNGQDLLLWSGEAVSQASPRRFVTDSMIASSGDGNGVVAAWFTLVRVGGTLRVRLTMKGKMGTSAATPADAGLRFASEFQYPDFEARLAGLDYVGVHTSGGYIFRVTWIEQTKLWSILVWINGSTLSTLGGATQVPNGIAARSPKLKASTTRGPGVLFARNGTVLFHQW